MHYQNYFKYLHVFLVGKMKKVGAASWKSPEPKESETTYNPAEYQPPEMDIDDITVPQAASSKIRKSLPTYT